MATAQQMVHALPPDKREQRFIELEEVWTRNLNRLQLLISNLVDSQRGQVSSTHLYRTPTDLTALVARVVAEMEILAEQKQLHLEVHLQPIPALLLDEEAIVRVVYNLLTNAIKFSASRRKVEVRLRPEGNEVVLEVEDQGRGIATGSASQSISTFPPIVRRRQSSRSRHRLGALCLQDPGGVPWWLDFPPKRRGKRLHRNRAPASFLNDPLSPALCYNFFLPFGIR